MEKTIRCVSCRAEFTEPEIGGATCCPTCGTNGVPMAIADDVQVTLNKHEIRIMTMWATNWAEQCDKQAGNASCRRCIGGIIGRLSEQLPGLPLTLRAEIQEVANQFGNVEVFRGDGSRETVKQRKPS